MAIDKIKRAFIWMRNTLRIIDRTTLPGEILGEVRPGIDTFGWDRLSPQSAGTGVGPVSENSQGSLASDIASLSAVPQGVMRYVIFASASHDDPVAGGLTISLQVRTFAPALLDIGISPGISIAADPARVGLDHPILLAPGEILLARSSPAPAAANRVRVRMLFVDIDAGEYILAR